jgi:hypothetical protein
VVVGVKVRVADVVRGEVVATGVGVVVVAGAAEVVGEGVVVVAEGEVVAVLVVKREVDAAVVRVVVVVVPPTTGRATSGEKGVTEARKAVSSGIKGTKVSGGGDEDHTGLGYKLFLLERKKFRIRVLA